MCYLLVIGNQCETIRIGRWNCIVMLSNTWCIGSLLLDTMLVVVRHNASCY